MGGLIDNLTGASARRAQQLQQAAAESAQNQALAAAAREQGRIDQAAAGQTGPRGRRLLTFIGASGADTMG